VCDSTYQTVADHIKTNGSGGSDDVWNLMPLCFDCHDEKGRTSVRIMAERYLQYKNWLIRNGWEIDYFGKWRRYV